MGEKNYILIDGQQYHAHQKVVRLIDRLHAENERLSLFEEWHTDLLERMEGTIGSSVTDLMERVAFLEAETERLREEAKRISRIRDHHYRHQAIDAALKEAEDG